jgi:4-hydroxy-3-polyprenylbenzoate decarboxylase
MRIEGPFGDHTGYYTLEEEYPFLEVSAITSKKEPIYCATVVGKPPLEDKYMGYATERIFLPLLKTTAPDLIDYVMPENGVFHNLIIAKIKPLYPAHAKQIMHAFWGVGQMSFVKHAIFVGEDAPNLRDYEALTKYILNKIDIENILISSGVVDALDHSSPKFAQGGKLGIDCTCENINFKKIELLKEEKLKNSFEDIVKVKHYFKETQNPITFIAVNKTRNQKELFDEIVQYSNDLKIVISVDYASNDLDNAYMLLWRVVNNIDASRDIYIKNEVIFIDATNKNKLDGFNRRWPGDVECNLDVLNYLEKLDLIDLKEAKAYI